MAVPFVNPFTTGSAATSLVPGQTFGQRYQIISLLGVGGMGAVYHVWDSELALSLALKVIKPDSDPLATQELERRFKRELVLARQVTHTNVIRIHDLGEIDGIKYITMPFVHGTDLARLLATEGKLPIARALPLARQMVSGLRAAHEVGIVHRDLKPANILIDDTEKAVITDFGIARSTTAGTFATAAGAIIGTLAYMAPEQATGKQVDQRADIYAFGLILSEMLVGKRGSSGGDTALALLIERASHAPPRMRTIDPTIPEALDRVVARCVEPDPAARYQTTTDLEDALERLDAEGHERHEPVAARRRPPPAKGARWPGVAAAIALGLATGLWRVGISSGRRPTLRRRQLIAYSPKLVLIADFDNKANDPVFAGSLEQALNIGIEGASFITTYSRTGAQALLAQLKPGSKLDEALGSPHRRQPGHQRRADRFGRGAGQRIPAQGQGRGPGGWQGVGDGRCCGARQGRRAQGGRVRRLDIAVAARRHHARERAPRRCGNGHDHVPRRAPQLFHRAGSVLHWPVGGIDRALSEGDQP